MIGPINKVLEKNFLVKLLENFRSIGNGDEPNDKCDKVICGKGGSYFADGEIWSIYCLENCAKVFYENYIKQNPVISYCGEDFHVISLMISNMNSYTPAKSYTNEWDACDSYDEKSYNLMLQYRCTCEDYTSGDSEEDIGNNKQKYELYSLKYILDKIGDSFDGKYFSQPASHTSISGAQYGWEMTFSYSTNEFNIKVELGPKPRNTNLTRITGHTGSPLKPIIESTNHLCKTYMPDNLFFEDDFIPIIKACFRLNENKLKYKGVNYKLIDYRFSEIESGGFSCGCFYSYVHTIATDKGIEKMPNRQSYAHEFHVSCTPEWYIQVQFGQSNSGSYLARFILEKLD
jgi:hypothetical protein